MINFSFKSPMSVLLSYNFSSSRKDERKAVQPAATCIHMGKQELGSSFVLIAW